MKKAHGNILLLLLVGIALFAALSFAALEGGSTQDNQYDTEKNTVEATRLIQYMRDINTGYRRLRMMNNCRPEYISFEHADWNDGSPGSNADSPADENCHLFAENGGKATYKPYSFQYVLAGTAFLGHGPLCTDASCSELAYIVRLSDTASSNNNFSAGNAAEICMAINDLLHETNTAPQAADIVTGGWDGSFDYTAQMTVTELSGKKIGCLNDKNGDAYSLYNILEVR